MSVKIPFNKPFIAGKELYDIAQAVTYGNLSGDGQFTRSVAGFSKSSSTSIKCCSPLPAPRPSKWRPCSSTWGRAMR